MSEARGSFRILFSHFQSLRPRHRPHAPPTMFLVNMLVNCFGNFSDEDLRPDPKKIESYPLSTRALAALEAKKAAEEAAKKPCACRAEEDATRDWGLMQTSPLEEGIRANSLPAYI